MMDEPSPVINIEALAVVPTKRKRGRPRKCPALDDPNSFLGDGNPSDGGKNFHFPPVHRGLHRNKSRQVYPSDDLRDVMTGQAVSGFLGAEVDGGFLLTVRVRNSDTVLRGIVFKPGHFVPVSAENDVAPNVHMVKRNDAPFQSENYGHARGGSHPHSRESKGVAYPSASPSAGSVALKSKLMPAAPLQMDNSVRSRGNVVPVVLQPVTSMNGVAFTQNQRASLGNQDSHHLSPSVSQITQPAALQVLHPVQSTLSAKQALKNSENGHPDEPSKEASYEEEIKPMILPPGMSFQNLVKEVIKRTQTPQTDNAENSQAVGRSSSAPEDGFDTQEQCSLLVEPFQPVQSNPMNLFCSVPKPLEGERTGKMTELLQAVQENAMKNQMPDPL